MFQGGVDSHANCHVSIPDYASSIFGHDQHVASRIGTVSLPVRNGPWLLRNSPRGSVSTDTVTRSLTSKHPLWRFFKGVIDLLCRPLTDLGAYRSRRCILLFRSTVSVRERHEPTAVARLYAIYTTSGILRGFIRSFQAMPRSSPLALVIYAMYAAVGKKKVKLRLAAPGLQLVHITHQSVT